MSWSTVLSTLTGLSVAGVTRVYAFQPSQINSADLPCMFPALPVGSAAASSFGGATGLRTYNINLAIIVEQTRQGLPPAKWTAVTGMMDALHNALEGVVDNYSMRVEETAIGETAYWVVVAEVEVSE